MALLMMGIVEAKAESMIEAGVTYDHILSLISLAAGERLRELTGDAYGLGRARRYGDHGRVVPPEFADIAVGEGAMSQDTVVQDSITNSQWEQTEGEQPKLNGDAATNGEKETSVPVQTVAYQGTINATLRELAASEMQAEKERVKKREDRRRKLAAEGGDENATLELAAELLASQVAPPKMTKKELTKKAKENSTEAQTVKQSNQTAAMMALGKKKKYSWMTGGAADMPTNKYAKDPKASAPGSGTATPKVGSGGADPLANAAPQAEKLPTWGDWREDNVNGKSIQLRDWIRVLERDGKEKKALQSALNKLS